MPLFKKQHSMAKDPAMLWYWNDWNGGTMTMSRFEKGCYIDVMCAMFNSGPLSLEKIKRVLGTDFGQCWPAIQGKFKRTDDDLFFNERMELEKERRKNFITKQSENGKRGGKPKSNPTLNPNQTQPLTQTIPIKENRNENRNEGIKGGTGGYDFEPIGIVPEMLELFKNQNPEMFSEQVEDFTALREMAEKILKWKEQPGRIMDQANRELIKQVWEELITHIGAHSHYREYSLTRINKHFATIVQSFNNRNKTGNGNSKQQSTGGARARQTQTSLDVWDEIREFQQLNANGSGVDSSEIFSAGVSPTNGQ